MCSTIDQEDKVLLLKVSILKISDFSELHRLPQYSLSLQLENMTNSLSMMYVPQSVILSSQFSHL